MPEIYSFRKNHDSIYKDIYLFKINNYNILSQAWIPYTNKKWLIYKSSNHATFLFNVCINANELAIFFYSSVKIMQIPRKKAKQCNYLYVCNPYILYINFSTWNGNFIMYSKTCESGTYI